jgi:hypothetical protein
VPADSINGAAAMAAAIASDDRIRNMAELPDD